MSGPPPGSARGHARNISEARRVPMARRSTKGPLDMDVDEKTSASAPPTPTQRTRSPFTPAIQTNLPPSPGPPHLREGGFDPSLLLSPDSITSYDTPATPHPRRRSPSPNTSRPLLDLTPLLRPAHYNPIPTAGVPPPFLHASQPAPNTPIQILLEQGHFRQAAERCATTLCSSEISPFDIPQVLELYHTRLASLILLSHPELAAKESRALLDLLARETNASSSAPGSRAGSADRSRPPQGQRVNPLSLIPWDLRLLLERLKTVLTNDPRRQIMNLYALGSECRANAAAATRNEDSEMAEVWRRRLADLGLRVAAALVDMGENETALRHLTSLDRGNGGEDDGEQDEEDRAGKKEEDVETAVRTTLLYLRLGHLEAAKATYTPLLQQTPGLDIRLLDALYDIASGAYPSAVAKLKTMREEYPDNELVRHNLAVALLYAGDVSAAAGILEQVVDGGRSTTAQANTEEAEEGHAFPALLFNLATIYELRTERAREKKIALVERVARLDRSGAGLGGAGEAAGGTGRVSERQGVEFKL